MPVLDAIGHALALAGSMTWQVTWSLILGFTLSAVVQAVVRRETVTRLIGGTGPRSLAVATGLGAASSSCSYAAVALARALLRRGSSFTAAMAFEIAWSSSWASSWPCCSPGSSRWPSSSAGRS